MPSDIADEEIAVGKEAGDDTEVPDELSGGLSSLTKYRCEWEKLISSNGLELAQAEALSGGLRTARLRSVAWRLLLGVLPAGEPTDWNNAVSAGRQRYRQLKESLAVDPRHHSPGPLHPLDADNPLSQHNESMWNQYFCDSELKSVIQQDVIRTFPSLDFFRSAEIQQVMVDILFCYARENPAMCYRQGMHEVLAPILFVLTCDQQAMLHLRQQTSIASDIFEIVNPAFLEEDGYLLFQRVMDAIQGSYKITNIAPLATGHFPPRNGAYCENQVVGQLERIKENILAPNDPKLTWHLDQLDIPLPLFAIRWVRLLFGREFPLEDLLVLWDAIFACDNASFQLVDYIVAAMLIAIRTPILESDYTGCLSLLMRYPGTMDIMYIIDYALHLKEPAIYPIPKSSGFSQLKRRGSNMRKQSHGPQQPVSKSASTAGVEKKTPGAPSDAALTNDVIRQRDPLDGEIVDGYRMEDPAVLERELVGLRRTIATARSKLLKYHAVLDNAVPRSDEPSQRALVGILQVCRLLDPTPALLLRAESVEVAADAAAGMSPPGGETRSPPGRPPRRKPSVDMIVFRQESSPVPGPDLPVPRPYS